MLHVSTKKLMPHSDIKIRNTYFYLILQNKEKPNGNEWRLSIKLFIASKSSNYMKHLE